MKEEKAIAFVRELQEKLISSNHSGFYIINEILGVAYKSFMIGYSEATRWRDPEEELTEEAGCDFCRDEQGYTIGNMYVCDKCGRQVP